jgi:uncharacterized membrane protein YfcA
MTLLIYVLVGLGVGLISGALGIGGGVLLIPLLMGVFHFSHREAIGTTLGVLVLPVLIVAAWRYDHYGFLNRQAAVCIALGFAIGAPFGAEFVSNVTEHWLPLLRILFGLTLIYIGVRYVLDTDNQATSALLGLISVAVSLLAFWYLRMLGRRYQPRTLAHEIEQFQQRKPDEPDYYI